MDIVYLKVSHRSQHILHARHVVVISATAPRHVQLSQSHILEPRSGSGHVMKYTRSEVWRTCKMGDWGGHGG